MSNKFRRNTVRLMLIVCILLFLGCSSAGPFVTGISSDGRGNLIIEKNTVEYNSFTGTVSLGDNPSTTVIQVIPQEILDEMNE